MRLKPAAISSTMRDFRRRLRATSGAQFEGEGVAWRVLRGGDERPWVRKPYYRKVLRVRRPMKRETLSNLEDMLDV